MLNVSEFHQNVFILCFSFIVFWVIRYSVVYSTRNHICGILCYEEHILVTHMIPRAVRWQRHLRIELAADGVRCVLSRSANESLSEGERRVSK